MKVITCVIILVTLIKCVITESWEDTHIICPTQCVCQYSHFMDLSIARWINWKQTSEYKAKDLSLEEDDLINENEALFAGDDTFASNPLIKLAMCLLQAGSQPKDLLNILPNDVQALIILYTGEGKNVTVTTSDIKSLNELTTLEIRGSNDHSFQLIIDEPLNILQNLNLESIQLIGSEKAKRRNNPIHPSESFDYVPNSEKITYNITLEMEDDDEIKILPYDVYLMEMHKSRMPTFYGWESLSVLRIHNSKLDELHFEMFDGLNQLQHLSLEHNEIKIVPPFAVYGALHIKTLSLAHNYILDLNYRSLAGLLDLEMLDLSHNNISKLSELTFPPFPKLDMVDFRDNPVRYIFSDTFGVMNNTITMLIGSSNSPLELTTVQPFDSLVHLKFLTILNATATLLDQNTFKGLKSLEVLKLRGDIEKIEFDAFIEMPKLRELDMSNCSLNAISMDAFIGCKNLEIVDLSHNNLSYIPMGLFDDQNNLLEIYLNNNRLRYLPSNFFMNPSLKIIRLTGNPWKCSCDMAVWKQKITNQYRGPKQERCIREFHSGKVISCKYLDKYKFDNKLSPRCANFNNRTIYYSLRRDLQCDLKKEIYRWEKHHNKMTKWKLKNIEMLNDKQKDKVYKKPIQKDVQKEEIKKNVLDKKPKTIREMNMIKNINVKPKNSKGNNILGNVDSYESFNYT